MSTFSGKIQEIPNISIDRFDDYNLKSDAYFLSHCHYDHMVGLNSDIFQNALINNNKFLYVSDVSCEILQKMHPGIRNNIKVLDMYTPTSIMLKDKNISVIPLPAGHCPGSVMFLFETDVTCILYTGDYRINKNDIKKFKSFYNSLNEIKIVDKIYLDTTFFLKRYLKFPKREESFNELCKIIKEWTDRDKNHVIKLFTGANYGYEYVFNEIYKKIGMPVHVNHDVYEIYSVIPEMDNSITVDSSLTQIHFNCGRTYQSICYIPDSKLRIIKISAIRWEQDSLENGLSSSKSNMYYVCYSTHASYEEGVELIKFLKPKSIEACVTYDDPHKNVEIMNLIKENLEELRTEEATEDKPKLFESEIEVKGTISNNLSSTCPFNDDFGILDSPPRENEKHFVKPDLESLKNLEENETTNKSIEDKTNEFKTEMNAVGEVSHDFESQLGEILDLSPSKNAQTVLHKAGFQNMGGSEIIKNLSGESHVFEEESIYSVSSESSSSSDDILILDSPPIAVIEKEKKILTEQKSDLVNDIITIDSPPRKKLNSNF